MLKVFLETFGCQMNVADSGILSDLLAQHGYSSTNDIADADLIVVNTCSVRENAELRAKSKIAEYAALRRKRRRDQAIWVIGCMAQRLGESLKKEIPGVDRVIGAKEIETIHEHILEYLEKKANSETPRVIGTGVAAFVPVMRGCDNYCSYCIVPYVRGAEHSVPVARIVDTVKGLVDKGTKEVTLLGQNVNSYRDAAADRDFAGLLETVHRIDGLLRIRFTTSHPKDCGDRLIRAVAELPKVCKHFHLPLQSGSTRILGLMNRTYTREDYLRLIDRIRERLPLADITTDVMVAFPTETEDDFVDTMSLVSSVKFTAAFMFAYSARPGTKAQELGDTVSGEDSSRRLAKLVALQTGITRDHYLSMVGRTVDVLITERQSRQNGDWMGHDYGFKRVLLPCSDELAGMILPLHVASTSGMTLQCERMS
jgi:tRNA-2-methylthio-N6-dimethylallyladenosine synthase